MITAVAADEPPREPWRIGGYVLPATRASTTTTTPIMEWQVDVLDQYGIDVGALEDMGLARREPLRTTAWVDRPKAIEP